MVRRGFRALKTPEERLQCRRFSVGSRMPHFDCIRPNTATDLLYKSCRNAAYRLHSWTEAMTMERTDVACTPPPVPCSSIENAQAAQRPRSRLKQRDSWHRETPSSLARLGICEFASERFPYSS